MSEIQQYIENSGKITSIFGHWPLFHDAEVIEFHLWRGNMDPETQSYVLPVLTAKIHLFLMTSEIDAKGYYGLIKHTLATLRFHGVENVQMSGFNYQNAIYELAIERQPQAAGAPASFSVKFNSAFGIDAAFECDQVEVLDAVPCDPKGNIA